MLNPYSMSPYSMMSSPYMQGSPMQMPNASPQSLFSGQTYVLPDMVSAEDPVISCMDSEFAICNDPNYGISADPGIMPTSSSPYTASPGANPYAASPYETGYTQNPCAMAI